MSGPSLKPDRYPYSPPSEMPLNIQLLEQFGCSNDRLREVFTASALTTEEKEILEKAGDNSEDEEVLRLKAKAEDYNTRKTWEKIFCDRLHEAVMENLRTYRFYYTVDLAYDGPAINSYVPPLMALLQGRITEKQCLSTLKSLGVDTSEYCTRSTSVKNSDELRMDPPIFTEASLNFVHTGVRRKVAAFRSRRKKMQPYCKYQTRSSKEGHRAIADILTERLEVATDQYGYKEHDDQVAIAVNKYGWACAFYDQPWHQEEAWSMKQVDDVFSDGKIRPASYIKREGLTMVLPHPTRVFWDRSMPLSAINRGDLGWVGYWDIRRYGEIADDPAYFNTDSIELLDWHSSVMSTYYEYFNHYFSATQAAQIKSKYEEMYSPGENNDRMRAIGRYSAHDKDSGIYYAKCYVKARPEELGLVAYNDDGIQIQYPYDLWFAFTVVGDGTVIHAEIMGSRPAEYADDNLDDSRFAHASFAHSLMPFQDWCSNILTDILTKMKQSLKRWVLINKDIFKMDDAADETKKKSYEEVEQYIRDTLEGRHWNEFAHPLFMSFYKMRELGMDPKDVFRTVGFDLDLDVGQKFKAIGELMSLMDRITVTSPQELGQPAIRGDAISATEAEMMNRTVSELYNFTMGGLEKALTARKENFYDALMAFGCDEIKTFAKKRYRTADLAEVGLVSMSGPIDETQGQPEYVEEGEILTIRKASLEHDFVFTSQDGLERPIQVESANALTQALQALSSDQQLMQVTPASFRLKLFQAVFRMTTGEDLPFDEIERKLRQAEGGEGQQPNETQALAQQVQQLAQSVQQALQGLQQQIQQTSQRGTALEQRLAGFLQGQQAR